MKSTEELLRAYSEANDKAALQELFHRQREDVYLTARRILRNDADALDATQATFLQAMRRIGTLREAGRFPAWLRRISVNVALGMKRSRAPDPEAERERLRAVRVPDRDEAQVREELEILKVELDRLPEGYRLPIVLHHCEGLSYEEIGRLLACPKNTVGTKIHRGLERLRAALTPALAHSAEVLLALLGEAAPPPGKPDLPGSPPVPPASEWA